MEERHIRVPRTARYHVLGDVGTARAIWIVLHGYGQLARFFLNAFEGQQQGLLIVAPEGLSRFYLDEAHKRVGATWMTREDREHEIQDQIGYLDTLTDLLMKDTGPVPLHVLGFSQGVATAARWSLAGTQQFADLVFWSGTLPPEPSAELLAKRWKSTRVHLVHGEKDTITGPDVLDANSAKLRKAGVQCQVHRFGGGHQLDPLPIGRLLHP
ncbi:MAG: phospholipase [Flavobacteriales bacterium]|nr:hypothetical protein [Flavobacteriales bacterium]MCB9166405.1 phospholipase [Flavobacteriales bacterium]